MDVQDIERALRAGPPDEPRYVPRELAAADAGASARTIDRRPRFGALAPVASLAGIAIVAVAVVAVLLQARSFGPGVPPPTASDPSRPCAARDLAATISGVRNTPGPGIDADTATGRPLTTSRQIEVAVWNVGDSDCEIPFDMRARILEVSEEGTRWVADSGIESQSPPVSAAPMPAGAHYSGSAAWWSTCNRHTGRLVLELRLATAEWLRAAPAAGATLTAPQCLELANDAELLPVHGLGVEHPPLPPHIAPPADLTAPTTLRLRPADGSPAEAAELSAAAAIIDARLAARGWPGEAKIVDGVVEVAVERRVDAPELDRLVRPVGEVSLVAPTEPATPEAVGRPAPPGELIAGPEDLLSATTSDEPLGTSVELTLSDAAAGRLEQYTRDALGESFLIVVDGVVVSAPVVNAPISGPQFAVAGGDVELLGRLATFVAHGPLPVTVEVDGD